MILRAAIEHNPLGKRPLEKSMVCWENVIKKDVEQSRSRPNLRILAIYRELQWLGFETGWPS